MTHSLRDDHPTGPVGPGPSLRSDPRPGAPVTATDLALAAHLEESDPHGTASHVELAAAARRYFEAYLPQRWPVEPKVVAGTVTTFAVAALIGLLDAVLAVVPGIPDLPSWVTLVVLTVVPPLSGLLRAYRAPHQYRTGEQAQPVIPGR